MKKIIEFRDTTFFYNSNIGFKDFNMEINEGEIVSLIGPACSGKTTILKMLCHKLPNDTVYYKSARMSHCDVDTLKKNIVVIMHPTLKYDDLKRELEQYLPICQIEKKEQQERYGEIVELFDLKKIADRNLNTLSLNYKNLIMILKYLIIEPRFLAIDCVLDTIDDENKKKIFKFIKDKKITLLNVTNNLSDTLYGEKIYVIDDFELILEGSTKSVLKTDTLLKRLGFELPVPIELSIELNNYGVIDQIYTDGEDLVNELWK